MSISHATRKISQFNGLVTTDEAEEIRDGTLSVATNVDITRRKRVARRTGYRKQVTASIDSTWADNKLFLYQSGTELYSFTSDNTSSLLRAGLTEGGTLAAERLGDQVFYSNGYETGVVEDGVSRRLGVSPPSLAPSLSATSGSLPAGDYQANYVYVRSDGQHSGTGANAVITLGANSGVTMSNLQTSSDPSVTHLELFLSSANGRTLYRIGSVNNGTSSFSYTGSLSDSAYTLQTQYKSPPPAFYDAAFFNSRMLYATNELVIYSDPFAYELVDTLHNYLPIPGRPHTFGIVTSSARADGVFVGTDTEVYFLQGSDIADATLSRASEVGMVPGTLTYIPGEVFLDGEQSIPLPAWVSKRGVCVGLPGGQVIHLTERTLDLPEGLKGSMFFRRQSGQNHLVFSLKS